MRATSRRYAWIMILGFEAFIDSTMVYVKSMPFRTRSEYDFYKPAYM